MTARPGFSLAELLVAMVLACTIAAAAMDSVVRQQRWFADSARIAAARTSLAQGAAILSSDLRGVAPADGDLYLAQSDRVEFRMLIGASVLCTIPPARDAATLPPLRDAGGLGLTAWVSAPVRGDTMLVFDAGAPGPSDDRWSRHVLTADAAPGGPCPVATGFTASAAEASAGWRIAITPPLAASIPAGAPVRFFRRARFELYRAADSKWYLGWLDCLATRATPCATVQPVAGPYEPGGVAFAFMDSSGAPAASPALVSLIDLSFRANAPGAGVHGGVWRDSLRAAVAVRD